LNFGCYGFHPAQIHISGAVENLCADGAGAGGDYESGQHPASGPGIRRWTSAGNAPYDLFPADNAHLCLADGGFVHGGSGLWQVCRRQRGKRLRRRAGDSAKSATRNGGADKG